MRKEKIDRTNYEFTKETILAALRFADFRCEECHRSKPQLALDGEKPYFEMHHILGIEIAVRYFPEISAEVIKSIANCEVVCRECHREIHRQKQDYFAIAENLLKRARVNV